MKAIQIQRTGGVEALRLVELPMPSPGPEEVLVRIEASGVNFIDTYIREGRYPVSLPYTLGQEAAGTIERVGSGVTGFREGERVAWCGIAGTYAEYAVAPAERLVKVPEGMSLEDACAAILQGMTAHYLVHDTYPVQRGDAVLIHAGAGGTGLLLTQLAKSRGARVIATVSTPEKAALSRAAGADEVILYRETSFLEEVMRLTGGKGLPVVFDSVGKSTFEDSLACLRRRGMMVLFGGASGAVPPFDLIRLSTMGSLYVTRPTLKDYIATREDLEARAGDVFQDVYEGRLRLTIGKTYSLTDASQAHIDLESRKTTGKLLLLP